MEIAVLLSVVITIVWGLAVFYAPLGVTLHPLAVSSEALTASLITLIIALTALILRKTAYAHLLTVSTIVALGVCLLLSIASTGNMSSPYLPLWVALALFGAVAGLSSFLPVITAVAVYGAYVGYYDSPNAHEWVVFALVLVVPVLIGFSIWRRRFQIQKESTDTVTELTHELSDETNKSEIIVNSIADGVLLLDANGIVQLINPAAQTIIGWGGEDAAKLDYRSVLKIIDSKNNIIEGQNDPVQQCLKTNQSVLSDRLGIRTTSGKQLLASIMASPLSSTTNAGAIVVFRDITAKRAEERDQAEFISTASHEMRTPVAAIEGYLGLALNPSTATIDEKARSYLGKAQDSAHHLGRLFQDLLDISKLEDGRMQNNPTILDVVTIVRAILEDFKAQFAEKGLTMIYTPDTNGTSLTPLFYVNADIDHFQEVMSNLVTNAIKYTKEGSVTIDVGGDNENVFISVTDSGIGIPAEDLPHLFQKFYRVDNSDTREIGGTGLGLYLSRRLSESMGGHLTVESTYGKGSVFTIDLPRVSNEAAQSAAVTNAVNKPTQTDIKA
jgi:PAS domain S-box-containing protein